MINGQELIKNLEVGKLKIGTLIVEYNENKKLVNSFIITKFRGDMFFDAYFLLSTFENETILTGKFFMYFRSLPHFQYKVVSK